MLHLAAMTIAAGLASPSAATPIPSAATPIPSAATPIPSAATEPPSAASQGTALPAAVSPTIGVPSAAPSDASLKTIVVTTADRKSTTLVKTPQTTYVVDKATIRADGYQTIADAIRNVPGVTFFQYGGFGAQAGYGTLGSTQSIVLLDGLPITAGSTGGVDLDTLSSSDVERIEVVESGGSTLYGSGGAGGIINIITSVPRSIYLLASYGSYGDRDVRISGGNGIVGGSLERHVATNDYPYVAQNGFPAGIRQNAQALQSDGSIDYGQTLGRYQIRATARFTSLDLGVPGEFLPMLLTPNSFDPSNRNDFSGKVIRTDGKFSTSLQVAGFRQTLFDNGDSVDGPYDALIDARTNAALEEVVRQSDRDSLVAGIDVSRETVRDILGIYGPPPEFAAAQSQSAIYAQQTIGVGPGGKFYGGLRAENDTPAGGVLEPAGGFLLPIGGVTIAGNAASSFIVPTLFDLYFPMYSNPDLLPERDRNLNLVVSDYTTYLQPKLTIFDRTANELITENAQFQPVNAGQAHFQGAVLSLSPRLFHTLDTQFSVTDLATATQVVNGVVGRVDYEPVLQGTMSIEHPLRGSTFGYGVIGRFAGAHTESSAGPGTFGQYSTLDAYLRAKLSKATVLTGRVNDLGDEHYGTFYAFPVPARTYRIELSTQ